MFHRQGNTRDRKILALASLNIGEKGRIADVKGKCRKECNFKLFYRLTPAYW
ncbi:MAG: hypothetical protein QMD21_03710 [Candidatus Thermoplasmatota archaeon]|nr:hypothetical protein [Candidatus Thermoplasmatota archaeon]